MTTVYNKLKFSSFYVKIIKIKLLKILKINKNVKDLTCVVFPNYSFLNFTPNPLKILHRGCNLKMKFTVKHEPGSK